MGSEFRNQTVRRGPLGDVSFFRSLHSKTGIDLIPLLCGIQRGSISPNLMAAPLGDVS